MKLLMKISINYILLNTKMTQEYFNNDKTMEIL